MHRCVNWAFFPCPSRINPLISEYEAIARQRPDYIFSLEEKRIRACPEHSAELLLRLC